MKSLWSCIVCLALMTGTARAERVLVDQDLSAKTLPAGWEKESAGILTRRSYALPDAIGGDGAYYRLTVTGRSVSRALIELAIRPQKGPKKLTWSARRELLEVPSNHSIVFTLPKQTTPQALIISVPQGAAELAKVHLVEVTRDELVAQMKKDFPKGGTAQNLLRVSRFPQGVQSGGAIGRDRSDEEYDVAGDPAVPGPSGSPALKLKCDQPLRFFVPPVLIPWTFTKHTASVYVRGHGSGSLNVIADGNPVASQPFTANSDDWQRVTLTFDPALMAREHQLVLDSAGAIHADAFQLEPGDKPTDYVKLAEVSLAFPDTDASVCRIHFDDDPAVIDFMVTGGDNQILNAKVYNIYGESRQLPDVALVGPAARGSLQYEVFPGKSFGAFRIEAWVEDRTGKRASPTNEIVILRVPRARSWDEDAPDSPFGIHLGPVHRQMVLAKAVGINWARLHDAGVDATAWSFVEPVKGQFHWKDANVKRYRDHHISLLGTLQQSPGWASGLGRPTADYWENYLEPTDTPAWENYVRETTTHYRDSIQAWDVWNEPWMKFWSKWDPANKQIVRSPTAADDYAKLGHATYSAAKSVDPTFRLLGLNSTGGAHGGKWTRDVADAGGLAPCDAYSYHSYTNETAGFPGDVAERHFHDALDPAIAKLGGKLDKPVLMTEGSGINLSITRGFYNVSAPGEDPEDAIDIADRLARYEVSTLAQGAEKIFLYHMNMGGEFRPGPGSFQTLVTDDGFPEPSAAAHAVLAWHLEGRRFVKRIEIAKGVFASIFVGEHHAIAVLTSAPNHDKYLLPSDVIALDLRDLFGNDLTGGIPFNGRTTYVDVLGTETDLEKALDHAGTKRSTTKPTRQ